MTRLPTTVVTRRANRKGRRKIKNFSQEWGVPTFGDGSPRTHQQRQNYEGIMVTNEYSSQWTGEVILHVVTKPYVVCAGLCLVSGAVTTTDGRGSREVAARNFHKCGTALVRAQTDPSTLPRYSSTVTSTTPTMTQTRYSLTATTRVEIDSSSETL